MLESEFVARSGYDNSTVGGALGPQPVDAATFGFGLALAQSMPGTRTRAGSEPPRINERCSLTYPELGL